MVGVDITPVAVYPFEDIDDGIGGLIGFWCVGLSDRFILYEPGGCFICPDVVDIVLFTGKSQLDPASLVLVYGGYFIYR